MVYVVFNMHGMSYGEAKCRISVDIRDPIMLINLLYLSLVDKKRLNLDRMRDNL